MNSNGLPPNKRLWAKLRTITPVGGIYAKLRLFEYWYGTDNKRIPFKTVEDLGALNWEDRHVVSALHDAERLAAAS